MEQDKLRSGDTRWLGDGSEVMVVCPSGGGYITIVDSATCDTSVVHARHLFRSEEDARAVQRRGHSERPKLYLPFERKDLRPKE